MPTINSIVCFSIIGVIPAPKMKLSVWTVPGINGYGAQQLGYQDQPFEVILVGYGSKTAAQLWNSQVCACQGKSVTIVDDFGKSNENCLVTEVGPMRFEAAIAAGGIAVRAECSVKGVVRT